MRDNLSKSKMGKKRWTNGAITVTSEFSPQGPGWRNGTHWTKKNNLKTTS